MTRRAHRINVHDWLDDDYTHAHIRMQVATTKRIKTCVDDVHAQNWMRRAVKMHARMACKCMRNIFLVLCGMLSASALDSIYVWWMVHWTPARSTSDAARQHMTIIIFSLGRAETWAYDIHDLNFRDYCFLHVNVWTFEPLLAVTHMRVVRVHCVPNSWGRLRTTTRLQTY